MKEIESILHKVDKMVQGNDDILAIGYVGSWARNQAKPTSDLDLMIVTNSPKKYLENTNWVNQFGKVVEIHREDWGLVQSWRVFFDFGEIEFGIATDEWTKVPSDPGTARVVSDGMKIVYDPQQLLGKLGEWVKANKS